MDSTNEDIHNLSSVSASDSSFITDLEGGKVTLTFTASNDLETDLENFKACHSVLELVQRELPLCALERRATHKNGNFTNGESECGFLQIPSLALVVFLQEEETEKFERAQESFEKSPWIFHHSESISRTMTTSVPANNLDYYRAGETGPLCGIRQMPTGKQIIRIVRFINYQEWQDTVDLYSLILGQKPEVTKPDFCLFTTGQAEDYSVQFAIKRAPKGITCTQVENVKLNFRINHPGHIVPLLPFVCENISEKHWQSKDFDGNVIRFESQDIPQPCLSERTETPDLSDLVLLEPIDSDSALSDSTINAYTPSSNGPGKLIRTNPVKPNYLALDRGQVEGKESPDQYQDKIYRQEDLGSPDMSVKLEDPWSPVSQMDSGQYSSESQHYNQTVLSSPESKLQPKQRQCGSNCSSDLGFQDRYSSSCASESRWGDDHDGSDFHGDYQADIRGPRRSYSDHSDHSAHRLGVKVFPHKQKSHSDHVPSESDGYASTCTNDEFQNRHYQSDQNGLNQNHRESQLSEGELRLQPDTKYPEHSDPKGAHIINNGCHLHASQEHLWRHKLSSSEMHLDTPQKYAFRKLKKYKESISRTEGLDLFNVSSYHKTSRSHSRPHRKHEKMNSYPTNDLKSVSELDSGPGSETEYEQAYESIERDLQIINKALYGKSSHNSRDLMSSNTKHKHRQKEKLTVLDSPRDMVPPPKEIPYVQGFYV